MNKKGIDVSKNNGKVNWNAVKESGHGEFAIIRCGYGSDLKSQDDSEFVDNVKQCETLNIPYGIYLYSYALNINDAKSEANHALRLLKNVGNNFKYGVWFDMEDADNYKSKNGMPSDSTLVDICYTFCELVEKEGYHTGIYSSLSWLENQLKSSKLDRFDKWVAQWNNTGCTYKGIYSIWQNSNSLIIDNKRFDSDILVRDFATESSKKSDETIAKEVIDGLWGNGADRKTKLEDAGYNYNAIQTIVNRKLDTVDTKYYSKYTGNSISLVDALKSIKVDSSLFNRTKIANKNGIKDYKGTSTQNTKLLTLLKQGKLVK